MSADKSPLGEDWQVWRARLEEIDFHPSRRLGQNFLLDPNLLNAIARDAEVGPGDRVIEIGTGLGFLTRALLATGAEVTSIEVDRRLHELLAHELGDVERLKLVRADALSGKHSLSPEFIAAAGVGELWHLVGNLPYAISGPLLAECACAPNPPSSMTVLVQKEMAERVGATVHESSWGVLGLRVQMSYSVRQLRTVGGAHFRPRPRVESGLIRLERRSDAPSPEVMARVVSLTASLFSRRRQVVRRVLGDLMGDRESALALLEELEIPADTRVQALNEREWLLLARARPWGSEENSDLGL
jgi:16S rRNA (adenine1518-N6/adenine1519-N6)-dimethyltransferase